MGKRGPPPKPTALRILEGNPSRRDLPEGEPKPTGKAECPAWLPTNAKQIWAATAPRCEAMGVLSSADTDQFASYCVAVATARDMAVDCEANGLVEDTARGRQKRPEAMLMMDAQRLAMQLGSRFGLTPSDRTKINIDKTNDSNPFAKLGLM